MAQEKTARPSQLPAIDYQVDGYSGTADRIMGRQAAGASFLRAYAEHADSNVLTCYTNNRAAAQTFAEDIKSYNTKAKTDVVASRHLEGLRKVGGLYVPDPGIGKRASLRLRAGVDAYSLTGVTHTTASHAVMDSVTRLQTDPVMPWDALICTSQSVLTMVSLLIEEQTDLLRWRYGTKLTPTLPQMPVIPLGIHTGDFDFSDAARVKARKDLGLTDDEVAILFVGRLSIHAKAHPHAMMKALQDIVVETGKKVVLVQCGWFANDAIRRCYDESVREICPDVRCLFPDGINKAERDAAWAAGDIFISLADNIQETFGLTPLEGMAVGMPVIVTDWDGYKESVPEGEAGFRIPTYMPDKDPYFGFAKRYEQGADSYDRYCGHTCLNVALDHGILRDRLKTLIDDPDLRRKMGAAGQRHVRAHYDWNVVFKAYLALWADLEERRAKATPEQIAGAPKEHPARMDPFKTFSHYPTHVVTPDTRLTVVADKPMVAYDKARALELFNYASDLYPRPEATAKILSTIAAQPGITMAELADQMGAVIGSVISCTVTFAKMGVLKLD